MPGFRYLNTAALSSGDVVEIPLGQYDRLPYRAAITVAGSIGTAALADDCTVSVYCGSDVEVENAPLNVAASAGRVEFPEDVIADFVGAPGEKLLVKVMATGTITANNLALAIRMNWF